MLTKLDTSYNNTHTNFNSNGVIRPQYSYSYCIIIP